MARVKQLEEENNGLREKIMLLEREVLKEVRHQLKQELMMRKELFRITKENNALEARLTMIKDVQNRQYGIANKLMQHVNVLHHTSEVVSSMNEIHLPKSTAGKQ